MEELNHSNIQEIRSDNLESLKKELEKINLQRSEILSKIMDLDPNFEDINDHNQIQEAYSLLLEQNSDLEKRIMFDGMTGLYSKSFMEGYVLPEMFEEKWEGEEKRKNHDGDDSRAILMIDADKFKTINDKYGHFVGDQVLKAIAEVIKNSVRFDRSDYPSRWGGEEILVLLTKASPYEFIKVAERINKNIKEARILENILGGKDKLMILDVTVSIGVAMGDKYSDWKNMLEMADKALYQSKNNGRDKVSLFQ